MANAQENSLINSRELISQAIQLHDSGEYKKAIEIFNRIDRNDTNYVWSLYERALSCEADSQFERGLVYCKEALGLKAQREQEPDLYVEYGDLLSDLKKYPEALAVYDEGLKKYPSCSLLYFNKGLVFINQEQYAVAEQLFKQTLLINPYLYSAHFFLGIAALKQGKIIPGMLSLTGYLLVNPEGKYWARVVNVLDVIANSKDEIQEYKKKRNGDAGESYALTEEIILSKIALEKAYKPLTALDDPISRQLQVLLEKIEFNKQDTGFYMQYYVPFFKKIYTDGHFELLINRLFTRVNLEIIQNYNKKHKKELAGLISDAAAYFDDIRSSRELQAERRAGVVNRYFFNNNELEGRGRIIDGKTPFGSWEFYYPQGNLMATGQFDDQGKRTGEWTYYFYGHRLKSREHYAHGSLEGEQVYYFDNGLVSSREMYANGKPDGISTSNYRTGATYSVTQYKMGNPDAERKEYYAGGSLHYLTNYSNGVRNGIAKNFFKNGQLSEVSSYLDNELNGPYKSYFENGNLSAEGFFEKNKSTGDWKYYYERGKLKSRRHFENDLEEGPYTEYYENGQTKTTYSFKKGKLEGESLYYDKDGKLFSRISYHNDIAESVRYFDKTGKQISQAERKDHSLAFDSYGPEGDKRSRLRYDEKGQLTGHAIYYYPSGKLRETDEYRDGKTNGLTVVYYRNGKKKSETPEEGGKENGYYRSYYPNGQLSVEGWLKDDLAQGEWLYYDELGKLSSKNHYVNGELSGYKEDYLPNGKKSLEYKYYSGWLEQITQYDSTGRVLICDSFPQGSGRYLLLYPNGNKMAEGRYVNGNLDGPYNTYFFDGSLESSSFYRNGMLDSSFKNFYYGGAKYREGQYSMGKKTGSWKSYDEDGKPASLSAYSGDQLNGQLVYYNSDGSTDFIIPYQDDERNGLAIKNGLDGSTAYATHYEEGDIVAYSYPDANGKLVPEIPIPRGSGQLKSYFANGKPSRACNFSDGKVNGRDILYYANGQVRSTDSSEYGHSQGPWKEYYANGKIKLDYYYVNDNLNGICREYSSKGVLIKEMNLVNGVLNGPVRYFNDDGTLRQTRFFYYGKLLSVKNEK
jgi:antitoxin component YwqK of YwqJK toxin-antitoxin module/tetratricopeptide (TPR) repeat protein